MNTACVVLVLLSVSYATPIPAEVTEEHLRALNKCKEIAQVGAAEAKATLIQQLESVAFKEKIAIEAPYLLKYEQ